MVGGGIKKASGHTIIMALDANKWYVEGSVEYGSGVRLGKLPMIRRYLDCKVCNRR
jgi:hypothetical protein